MRWSYTWLNTLLQTSHKISFTIMGLEENKRKKSSLSTQLSSAEELGREILDLFLIDRFLFGNRALLKEVMFLNQSGLIRKAEATLGMFSGKKINRNHWKLR